MPCACSARLVLGVAAHASRPPCTFGCSVFTRPSIISGKPVSSATSLHRQARLGERLARAAGRDDLDAAAGQGAGELDEAGLVGNGNQRTANGRHGYLFSPTRLTHNAAERNSRCADAASDLILELFNSKRGVSG